MMRQTRKKGYDLSITKPKLHSSCLFHTKYSAMKKIIAVLLIAVSIAACSNNSNNKATDGSTAPAEDASGGTTPSVTSGNNAARQGQEIPTDSVETSKDSTGNIHPGDTTKK